MSITMWDSIYVDQLPSGAQAYAGYVGGRWPTFATLQKLFPQAHLLSIAVFASEDAACLDVELGDATIAEIYGWFKRQQARGQWRPVIYSSAGNINSVVTTMTANGFPRPAYRPWAAHYGAGEHICGPSSCGLADVDCDGTQWTDHALGRDLDQSILAASFFPVPTPVPVPGPNVPPASREDEGMLINLAAGQRQLIPVWALAGAEKLPGAYSHATLTLAGDSGTHVQVTYHWQAGAPTSKDFALSAGKVTLADPPSGMADVSVLEIKRTDASISAAVSAVLNRWA